MAGNEGSFENLALFFMISFKKFYKFYSLNDLLSLPNTCLDSKIDITDGYPMPETPSFSSSSNWSPPCDHKNLNGFPLNFKPTSLIVFKYPCLYSAVESKVLGKKLIMHKFRPLQCSSYTLWEVSWTCSKIFKSEICSLAHSAIAPSLLPPS